MTNSPVCKRLKEARIAAGFSQKKLGVAAGIDELSASARMNQYETGKHTPDYQTLRRIAKILNLPAAYFYTESDDLAKFLICFYRSKKSKKMEILKNLEQKL